ncbi:protein of unknown function [Peptoclostridium litorale DSM 5388]|uniref:Uncharacterized protein n=1 Tax=Peptoclostridium litorale DSM 5388 TaxID=1121324 RepID=A0A069RFX6_PEPLI|nr:ImmA/IrrE family metallo-endopeptidase [Peptoclostridium litorale]KDR95944.1 hypothetical protein CLIT_8c01130 [Peptoclostridium litorale DSM 5388]SIO09481.1 protein of unknown function [Peptoclostridium litorale DSM 5388]
MIETFQLEEILTQCNIIKEFVPLSEAVLGYYSFDGEYYIILINESIKGDHRLYRTVLAEEIGHYRTTIGDITPRKYMCYSERLIINKKELLALKWAVNFLISTQDLLDIIKDKSVLSISEMADYFFVTEKFIYQKFEFMSKERLTWDIDSKRSLILSNLPSLFIYEKIK